MGLLEVGVVGAAQEFAQRGRGPREPARARDEIHHGCFICTRAKIYGPGGHLQAGLPEEGLGARHVEGARDENYFTAPPQHLGDGLRLLGGVLHFRGEGEHALRHEVLPGARVEDLALGRARGPGLGAAREDELRGAHVKREGDAREVAVGGLGPLVGKIIPTRDGAQHAAQDDNRTCGGGSDRVLQFLAPLELTPEHIRCGGKGADNQNYNPARHPPTRVENEADEHQQQAEPEGAREGGEDFVQVNHLRVSVGYPIGLADAAALI